MRQKLVVRRVSQVLVGAFVLAVSFNNCSSQHEQLSGSGDSLRLSFSGQCESDLLNTFAQSISPFLAQTSTCKSCHVEGGLGLGSFASDDMQVGLNAFRATGVTKVAYMATNPGHKPPYTGSQNQSAADKMGSLWPQAEDNYLNCVAQREGTGNESIHTSSKTAPTIYINSTNQTLIWDLESSADLAEGSTRSIPAVVSIDVKVLNQNLNGVDKAIGYLFANPKITMKNTNQQLVTEGIYIYINDQLIASQTTFTGVSKIITGTSEIVLMSANANTIISPISNLDSFSLHFRRLVPTADTGDSSPPPTPILSMTGDGGSSKFTRSQNVNVSILRDAGIVRWCLSTSATPPANTEAPCVGQEATPGTINGWFINKPKTAMVSAGDGAKSLYLWVANGDLKINGTPATASITLDSQAPAKPSLAVSKDAATTKMQIAEISISSAADASGWCLIEQPGSKAAPAAPALNDECWKWSYDGSKPTTVGFKGGGTRKVWLYVRDQAGNISVASDPISTSNPWGSITYTQLVDATPGNPRAVLRNTCYTCHGDNDGARNNPGYQALRLFEYGEAVRVGDNGLLVSRTNNPLSPMPNINNGLMDIKYRNLLRLWTSENDQGVQYEE